jgi:hypothetical protein
VESLFALERGLVAPDSEDAPSPLRISVVFTDFKGTTAALRQAARMSAGLDASIDVIVIQVVPFPLPLVKPPVPVAFTVKKLRQLETKTGIEPSIHVYVCRDQVETLLRVLQPGAPVVIGKSEGHFFTKTPRLIRSLRRNGHDVIVARSVI